MIFVLSFLIPQKNGVQSGETAPTREEVRQLLAEEIKQVRGDMQDMVDETVGYSVEKAERAMERLTNEKISAVSEFSNTVLTDINTNRDEVMFLYDMLNDKHENLKLVAQEVTMTTREAKRTGDELKELLIQNSDQEILTEDGGRTAQVATAKKLHEDAFVPFDVHAVEKVDPAKVPKRKKKAKASAKAEPSALEILAQMNQESNPPIQQETDPEKPQSAIGGNVTGSGNNNEKILQLHRMNKSNVMIAKELGLGVGEVKLVIDLYKEM
ncbi:MAG: hypothetical protein J6P60_04445 [Lachnospiraceae bacterium]|nr:hypothetical protein [Lachnospiraceae bacterium]